MKRPGGRLERLVHRVHAAVMDRRLGIDTRGTIEPRLPGAYSYATLSYREIDGILDALALGPDDVLVDIGCGKGRVLCRAAMRRLGAVEGVEIEPALADAARRNAGRTAGLTPVTVRTMAAEDYDYGRATALFLFNPFTGPILERVLDRIERTRAKARALRLVYVFPKHAAELAGRSWLVQDPRSPVRAVPSAHDIEVWRTADGAAADGGAPVGQQARAAS